MNTFHGRTVVAGWSPQDWRMEADYVLEMSTKEHPRYGSSAAVAIRSEYVVLFVAWLLGQLIAVRVRNGVDGTAT